VALDLRAQIAGNTAARARVLKLIERYGARVVKGVMKRVIENSEKSFLAKMATLPDGVWKSGLMSNAPLSATVTSIRW